MTITTYQEAITYLENFIGKILYKIDPEYLKHHDPLERMRVLFDLLDNPQERFKSVLVGGTSGKGSTAYLISRILTTAGYKTGLTISPHLQKVNERIQINNQSISDEGFLKLVNTSILSSIKVMSKMEVGAPSYFEILIAMAFLYFAQQKIDIAVVEVGMGGEFDATNTLYPLVAVLTNVSLDHTNVLGGTVQKIAKTKAGIIKEIKDLRFKIYESNKNHKSSIINHKSIVVTGVKQPPVIKIVEDKCKKVGAELFRLGKSFDFKIKKESLDGSVFDVTIINGREQKLHGLRISLLGRHQVENASLAIETVLQLRKFGFRVYEGQIRQGLRTSFFPGRFEVITTTSGSPRPLNDSSKPSGNTHLVNENISVSTAALQSNHDYKETVKSAFRGEARPLSHYAKAPRAIITPRSRIANSQLSTLNSQLVLDGAHNPTKMKAFLTSLKKLYPKTKKIFIVGFKFDKDIPKMLKQISKDADAIVVTEFSAKTDMDKNASADALNIKNQILKIKYDKEVFAEKDSKKALDKAFNILVSQYPNIPAIIVVTGSLYLVGEIRQHLFEIASPNKLGSQ